MSNTQNEIAIEAAIKLGSSLSINTWYSGVGISEENGSSVLGVFSNRKMDEAEKTVIPNTWDNLEVRLQIIGKVEFC